MHAGSSMVQRPRVKDTKDFFISPNLQYISGSTIDSMSLEIEILNVFKYETKGTGFASHGFASGVCVLLMLYLHNVSLLILTMAVSYRFFKSKFHLGGNAKA